ncbi:MAG TPA: energy transducer TonB [Terriglobales bacterium]|nr:energy transducer TonB [Terriglobales bacterium]
MSASNVIRCLSCSATAVVLCLLMVAASPSRAADDEELRHPKSKVVPVYPELAKKMNITGTVKLQLVIAPNGVVKTAKVIGGHPVLVESCVDAVKKWRYERAAGETSATVEFHFDGQ